MVNTILKRAVAFTACGFSAGSRTTSPVFTAIGLPPTVISASPSTACTRASNGEVCSGNVLVTIRDYHTLHHLRWVLQRIDTREHDIVVMEVRLVGAGPAEYDLSMDQIFSGYEQTLFTRAVSIAESFGKHISLLVIPARDVGSAIVQTAHSLESSIVVAGLSSKMAPQEQSF
jgi:hypothetical protein